MPDQRPPEAGAQTPHEVFDVPAATPAVTAVADNNVCQPERGSTLHAPSSAATYICALVRNERRAPSCC